MRSKLLTVYSEAALLEGIAHELPVARRVLAFAPHPDDEVFGCGGTLALLSAQGATVRAIVITDGEAGMAGTTDDAQQRREESRRAAEVLGCAPPEFWGLPDRGLEPRPLVDRIATAIAQNAADLVFLPAPLEIHPDHQALAIAGVIALGLVQPSCAAWFYEVSQPLAEPTHLIPIDAALATKQAAMRCFPGQLAQLPYDERILGLNRFRAYHLGAAANAAEAFVCADSGEAETLQRLFAPALRMRHLLMDSRRHLQRNQLLARANAELNRANAELNRANAELNHTLVALRGEIAAYRASTSWRLTAPLRAMASWLRKSSPRNPSGDD